MTPARKAYLLSLVQYPSFTVNESAVAHAWLVEHADEWDDVEFNVRLGTTVDLGPGFSDTTRAQAALLSQKRADMVATRGRAVAIIEVKLRVALSALGQLLGYEILWRSEFPGVTDLQLIAIGHDALIDVVEVLQAHGVSVELFPNVALAILPRG
jgi:hypothetical protein